ncbi:hypothetical protein A4S05_14435 [Nostoc sp. KVJ20]|uniref:hypothetical protein n=1 Tax=Nostoc sp. KVJ20 TaxID=457944 RepID=UPI00083E376B|nr:hypothetical protein [Nostoc sp. KVJ20]ODG97297.1 hypothetical protein A4S05_14435 [Nostoc sp. KVJ20]
MEAATLTATAIATLAFTKAFEKTIETLTEATLAKINDLRKKIWEKFPGNQKVERAIASAEKGSKEDLEKIAAYLQVAMDTDDQFAQEVQSLAYEIHQEIIIGKLQGQNVQNVYGGEAQQNNAIDTKAPVIQGGSGNTINIH